MARDFSGSPWITTTAINLAQSVGESSLTILDLYNRQPNEEALRTLLSEMNITVMGEIEADMTSNPENFASTSWVIPQRSEVDLLVNQGRIVGVRVRQEREP
jgi:hypothetical protein